MSSPGRNLSVNGLRLHVRDVGEGQPLLLINGIGAHVEMWAPLERALGDVRVISFDAPGTGRSADLLLPRTVPMLAQLVAGLLDRLGLERVDVLGYSFGGALAQQLAIDAPERVRRLVLAATTPGWGGVPGRLGALMTLSTPLRYYSRSVYTRTAGLVAGGRAARDADYVERRWRERLQHPPSMSGYTYQLWALTLWSSLRSLGRIAAPTLIVAGDDDPVVPLANPLLMASRMRDARVLVAADEGHFLLLDAESAALPAVRSFLAAPDLEREPVWRDAHRPTPTQATAQLRHDGMGAQPWGLASAAVRRACT